MVDTNSKFRWHLRLRVVALGVIALLGSVHMDIAVGASFDCRKAASVEEMAVCGDSQISHLDDALARSYSADMHILSARGQLESRDSERRWVHFAKVTCFGPKNRRGGLRCLEEKYRQRLKDLDNAAVRVGPFVFGRVDYFYAIADPRSDAPYEQQASYPRIDQPASGAVARWNHSMAPDRFVVVRYCDGSPGDSLRDFAIQSAGGEALTIQTTSWMYCHGTPHGFGGIHSSTYVLKPTIHKLTARDLFVKGTGWGNYLTKCCNEVLRAKDGRADLGRVRQVCTNVKAWSLTRDGLLVTVNPYEVLPYAFGVTEITVPWSDLRPFLVADAPVSR